VAQLPHAAAAEAEIGVFGPLEAQQSQSQEEDEDNDAEGEEVETIPRKRSLQLVPNGSPSKRPRLSNGYENGLGTPGAAPVSAPVAAQPAAQSSAQAPAAAQTASANDATPMEIDHQDNHAYPSPLEGERAPSPVPRTDGPEQGTQVDKVDELSPDTTFIRLNEDAVVLDASSPVTNENAPILLQCEWNPKDASLLAAAGTDALARVWTVPRATAPEPGQDHVSPPSLELIEPETPRTTTVTALSWTSDGSSIAVATDSGSRAGIAVTSIDGGHLYNIDVAEALVLKLAWNPSNTALLSICPDKGGFNVNVYSSEGTKTLSYPVRGDDAGAMALDATWTSDTEFLLCGGDMLLCLRCEATSIVQVRKFETKEDDSFTQVLFDWRSNLAATSSDKGTLDVSAEKLRGAAEDVLTTVCSYGMNQANAGLYQPTKAISQPWLGSLCPHHKMLPMTSD
jgi:WD40 repeat protein